METYEKQRKSLPIVLATVNNNVDHKNNGRNYSKNLFQFDLDKP